MPSEDKKVKRHRRSSRSSSSDYVGSSARSRQNKDKQIKQEVPDPDFDKYAQSSSTAKQQPQQVDAESRRGYGSRRRSASHDRHSHSQNRTRVNERPRHSNRRSRSRELAKRSSSRDRHNSPRIKQEPRSPDRQEEHRRERRENERRRINERRRRDADEEGKYEWGRPAAAELKKEAEEKDKDRQKPSFELSGKLAADTNMYNGVVIKYNEPPESRKPRVRWRLYPFKGEQPLPVLYIHRQSAYLMGRDRHICDIPIDHPSCSKQHAALQYRLVPFTRPDGSTGRAVKLYVIDLGSANGTYVNNKRIDAQRYVELLEKDVIKFGFSTREYVVLNEGSRETPISGSDEELDSEGAGDASADK